VLDVATSQSSGLSVSRCSFNRLSFSLLWRSCVAVAVPCQPTTTLGSVLSALPIMDLTSLGNSGKKQFAIHSSHTQKLSLTLLCHASSQSLPEKADTLFCTAFPLVAAGCKSRPLLGCRESLFYFSLCYQNPWDYAFLSVVCCSTIKISRSCSLDILYFKYIS